MYGLVNQAIEDMVRTHHGESVWERIRRRAGVEVEMFVAMEPYPDATSYALVQAASDELGQPAERLLEAFGEHWTLFTAEKGYGELFRMGGSTFREFMLNLHSLHTRVALSFPELDPPSFWCSEVTDTSLRLHYQSRRPGLGPMVVGLVRGLGRHFGTVVEVTPLPRREGADHEQFLVGYAGPPRA